MINILLVVMDILWIGVGIYLGYRMRKICNRIDDAVSKIEEELDGTEL